MSMALHLRRRPESEPASALFLPQRDVDRLLALSSTLGVDPTGRVYPVRGGFLLTLPASRIQPLAGVIRLRRLAPHVFIPVDADLLPALLDDEAASLGRDRGLVFLPWGLVLGFDPRAPLEVANLIVARAVGERSWRPLPEGVRVAERIEGIELERPDESPESILETGGPVGTDPVGLDDPEDSPSSAQGPAHGLGGALSWLGRTLGLPGLAKLGSGWAGATRRTAPGLTESALRRQAEALRSLLREFREGDVDRALRQAPPLGGPVGPRGASVETGDQLPPRDFLYSLGGLLDPAGAKSPTYWMGGRDVLTELGREYRKAAEQALKQGDYRRAALIYGKLLRDYRMAAHVLMQGGLHHDAAILLLNKLDDPQAAARAFEAAGEIDLAVRLYRRAGEHVEAGDLLRRIGEEEAALVEYRAAADQLLRTEPGHLAAGRLMAGRAGRPDLALEFFHAGWEQRPHANGLACLTEALALHATAASTREIGTLLGEADAYLGSSGTSDEVSRFYNFIARLADRPNLDRIRDALRDRARSALAAKLRAEARPGVVAGRMVSDFLEPGAWPPEVLSDAEFAVRAATQAPPSPAPRPRSGGPSAPMVHIGQGTVTAVCSAPETDEVFLGFEGGEVYCFRPDRSEVVHVASYNLPVASLAVSADGSSLVILRAGGHQRGTLSAYTRTADDSFQLALGMPIDGLSQAWLTPVSHSGDSPILGLWDGLELYLMTVPGLTSLGRVALPRPDACPPAALLLPGTGRGDGHGEQDFAALIHDGREWCLAEPNQRPRHATGLVWRPALPQRNSLRSVSLSWDRSLPEHLELVGLGGYGTLHWATLRSEEGRLDLVALNSAAREGGYLAACLVRSRFVAGVTGAQVEWLRCGADRFSLASATEIDLASAVACFPSRRTRELLIICEEGDLARIAIPH